MQLKIETQINEATHTILLEGDLDANNVGGFRKTMAQTIEAEPKEIVVDFSKVEFLDSTGIGAVIQSYKTVNKQGNEFRLVGMRGQPLQTFKFLKLNHLIAA